MFACNAPSCPLQPGIYLKHTREVKERKSAADESDDPPAKITRLAIGVEGGFEDKDQFEYEVLFFYWDLPNLFAIVLCLGSKFLLFENFDSSHCPGFVICS